MKNMTENITDLQRSFDSFFKDMSSALSLQVNPENADKVQKSFFKKKENLQFSYKAISEDTSKYANLSRYIYFPKNLSGDKTINHFLKKIHLELSNKSKLILSLGTPDFTKYSQRLYGKPSQGIIKRAEEILEEPYTKEVLPKIHADKVVQKLRKGFHNVDIKGWRIKKEDIVTSAVVSYNNRTLTLKKRERMQEKYVDRLTAHEIGTHVVRFENGVNQPLNMLYFGLPKYITTEEGLAAYNEYKHGFLSQSILRNYAGRVLAVKYAQEGDFISTYEQLLQHFSKKVAFKLTLRAKRGISDSSQPGGFTKDYVYLKGFFQVKKFAKKNDLKDLYYGKVGIKDIPLIKKLDFLQEPRYLPKYLKKGSENLQVEEDNEK